jgi:hypothetical protein
VMSFALNIAMAQAGEGQVQHTPLSRFQRQAPGHSAFIDA